MCLSKKFMIKSATYIKSLIENLLAYSFFFFLEKKNFCSAEKKNINIPFQGLVKAADSIIFIFLG